MVQRNGLWSIHQFTLHPQLLLSLIKGSFKNENHRTHAGTPKSSKPLLFCECPLPFHRHSANLQTGKHFTSLVDFSTSFDKCFRGPLLHAILFLKTIVAAQVFALNPKNTPATFGRRTAHKLQQALTVCTGAKYPGRVCSREITPGPRVSPSRRYPLREMLFWAFS